MRWWPRRVASPKKELQSGHVQIEQLRDGLSVNLAQGILTRVADTQPVAAHEMPEGLAFFT